MLTSLRVKTSYREKSDAAVDTKKADLTEETTYLEMKTAVEDVVKIIVDDSCSSAAEPCIDKDYILDKMSKIEFMRPIEEFLDFGF